MPTPGKVLERGRSPTISKYGERSPRSDWAANPRECFREGAGPSLTKKKGLPLGVKRKSEGWDWVFPKYTLKILKVVYFF